jgi:hypothetical protein
MRISRHDLRSRYPNSLVIDAGSQFIESLFAGYVDDENHDTIEG